MKQPKDYDVFELDKHHLDDEWENQPKLYYEAAMKLVDARALFEKAKAARDLIEAELDHSIRVSPEEFSLEKLTESVVAKTILRQISYHDANNEVLAAKKRMEELNAFVDALEHRKKALESLVYLHGQAYFAEPRLSHKQEKAISEKQMEKAFSRRKQP